MSEKIKKKKVIFFLPAFNLGGASESISKLAKFLTKKNYLVVIISIGKNVYKRQLINNRCKIIEINSKRSLFSILKLRKIIKNECKKKKFQTILISNIHYANLISLFASFKIKNLKIILTERTSLSELKISNDFFSYLKNHIIFLLVKYLYQFSNLVVTNSQYEKKFIEKKFKIKKIKCIYPPCIEIVKKKTSNLKRFKKIKIIYVGRLSKEKGVINIVKALNLIKDSYDFTFEIYGNGYEKKLIQKLVSSYNMKKKVVFKGFLNNRNKIFKNATLFINASKFEGLPNALVQSLNYNVFPICSNSPGGNMEVIKFGKLGLFFKNNDFNDLAKKINFFLKKKMKLNDQIRLKHLKKYTEIASNNKYLNILNHLK